MLFSQAQLPRFCTSSAVASSVKHFLQLIHNHRYYLPLKQALSTRKQDLYFWKKICNTRSVDSQYGSYLIIFPPCFVLGQTALVSSTLFFTFFQYCLSVYSFQKHFLGRLRNLRIEVHSEMLQVFCCLLRWSQVTQNCIHFPVQASLKVNLLLQEYKQISQTFIL